MQQTLWRTLLAGLALLILFPVRSNAAEEVSYATPLTSCANTSEMSAYGDYYASGIQFYVVRDFYLRSVTFQVDSIEEFYGEGVNPRVELTDFADIVLETASLNNTSATEIIATFNYTLLKNNQDRIIRLTTDIPITYCWIASTIPVVVSGANVVVDFGTGTFDNFPLIDHISNVYVDISGQYTIDEMKNYNNFNTQFFLMLGALVIFILTVNMILNLKK